MHNNNSITQFINHIIPSIVPLPILTITGSPRETGFYQGLDLMFTCSAQIDSAVDTPVTVMATWTKNGTRLTEDGSHITVTNVTMVALPYTYSTTVRLNPVDFDDAGIYACIVTVLPHNTTFINGTTVSATKTVTAISGNHNSHAFTFFTKFTTCRFSSSAC